MARSLSLIIVLVLIAGCSSTPPKSVSTAPSPEQLKWQGYFQKCMSATTFGEASKCRMYGMKEHLTEEQVSQAKAQWEKIFQASGPDFHLYDAITSVDLERMQKAIDDGADVNREFSGTDLFGPGGKSKTKTPLSLAANAYSFERLELIKLLLEHGADPNWRNTEGSFKFDMLTNSFRDSLEKSDGTTVIHGEEVGLLLLEYGYEPTAYSIKEVQTHLGQSPLRQRLYKEMMQAADSEVLATLERQNLESEREAEAKKLEVEKARKDLDEVMAAYHKKKIEGVREIGAKICKVEEGRDALVHVGFVERLAENKIQIRVVDAYYRERTWARPVGFESLIIWDYPISWQRCE